MLPTYSDTLEYEGLISTLARQRCRMAGVEYDDLVQEARLEVWTKLLEGKVPSEQNLINSMRRYMRAVKGGRAVVYEPVQSMESVPS